jgi:hypothetical protein
MDGENESVQGILSACHGFPPSSPKRMSLVKIMTTEICMNRMDRQLKGTVCCKIWHLGKPHPQEMWTGVRICRNVPQNSFLPTSHLANQCGAQQCQSPVAPARLTGSVKRRASWARLTGRPTFGLKKNSNSKARHSVDSTVSASTRR